MNSVWTESVEIPHFNSLEGEVKTDVLIIGGGITGLLCVYFLKEKFDEGGGLIDNPANGDWKWR